MNSPYSEIKNNFQIKNLTDVNITNPDDIGQLLTHNGSNWVSSYDIEILTDDNNLKIKNSTYKSIKIGNLGQYPSNYNDCITLGTYAGSVNLNSRNVAIGFSASENNKGSNSVSIGYLASADGCNSSSTLSIGREAGFTNQGCNSVSVGAYSGYLNQHNNTIIINATGSALNSGGTDRFYVKPVRQLDKGQGKRHALYYNSTTGEITYTDN